MRHIYPIGGLVALLQRLRWVTLHKPQTAVHCPCLYFSPRTCCGPLLLPHLLPPNEYSRYVSSVELATKVATYARPTTRFFVEEGKLNLCCGAGTSSFDQKVAPFTTALVKIRLGLTDAEECANRTDRRASSTIDTFLRLPNKARTCSPMHLEEPYGRDCTRMLAIYLEQDISQRAQPNRIHCLPFLKIKINLCFSSLLQFCCH